MESRTPEHACRSQKTKKCRSGNHLAERKKHQWKDRSIVWKKKDPGWCEMEKDLQGTEAENRRERKEKKKGKEPKKI